MKPVLQMVSEANDRAVKTSVLVCMRYSFCSARLGAGGRPYQAMVASVRDPVLSVYTSEPLTHAVGKRQEASVVVQQPA